MGRLHDRYHNEEVELLNSDEIDNKFMDLPIEVIQKLKDNGYKLVYNGENMLKYDNFKSGFEGIYFHEDDEGIYINAYWSGANSQEEGDCFIYKIKDFNKLERYGFLK